MGCKRELTGREAAADDAGCKVGDRLGPTVSGPNARPDRIHFQLRVMRQTHDQQATFVQWVNQGVARVAAAERGQGHRVAVLRRYLAADAPTLAEVGVELGITRERVRQLRAKVFGVLLGDGSLLAEVERRLTALRSGRRSPLRVDELPRVDAWFVGLAKQPFVLGRILAEFEARHRTMSTSDGEIVTLAGGINLDQVVAACRARFDQLPPRVAPTDQAIHAIIDEELSQRELQDLQPLVVAAIKGMIRTGNGFVLAPTHRDRVEAVLQDLGGIAGVAEIVSALQAQGVAADERTVRGALERADVVREGRSRYVLRSRLRPYDRFLPRVREDVVGLMLCEPHRQWRADDLRGALIEAEAAWAEEVPPHALEHLMHQVDELVYLARSYWGLRQEGQTHRLKISDLAVSLLEANGEPMTRKDLRAALSEHRSLGVNYKLRFPVVSLGDRFGLAPRDLGLNARAFERLRASVRSALECESWLSPERIRKLLREATPNAASMSLAPVLSLLTSEVRLNLTIQQDGLQKRPVEGTPRQVARRNRVR